MKLEFFREGKQIIARIIAQMEAGTRVDILLFVYKWSVLGFGKWKFGGKIMWKLDIRGLKCWKAELGGNKL